MGMYRTPIPATLKRTRPQARARALWRPVLALLVAALFLFPFYWVVITSLNAPNQVLQFPPSFWPHGQWQNYTRAWSMAPWLTYFGNTILIAACTTILVLVTSIFAGFAFGRMTFPGKGVLFALYLSLMMVPQTVLLIPDYIILRDLNWLNTYQAQIVPWGASVFGVFLLRQFFMTVPKELFEAAALDGASRARTLWQIVVPMAKPVLVTVALYIFLGSWNAFLWPYIMTTSPRVQPIEVGLATFLGANGTDWTGLSAAVVFSTLPVMILFLIAQRQFLAGAYATGGGLKG